MQAIAAIARLEVHFGGVSPQGLLEVTYFLSSTCTMRGRYEVEHAGDHFDVRVFNTEPAGYQEQCDGTGNTGQHQIRLEGFEAGRVMTVSVNGVSWGTLTVPSSEEEFSVELAVSDRPAQVQTMPNGNRVEIGVGQSVELPDQDMGISFDRVVDDSRCPANVTCIWAGETVIRLTVSKSDTSAEALLSQEPGSGVESP